jgi:hypothetical protein
MAISIFDPRVMDQMVRVMPSTGGFFRDTFFKRRVPVTGTKIDVDFYKGKRRIAPFINPRGAGKSVEKIGYKTDTFETPVLRPLDILTIEDLSVRAPGENVYGGLTREDRAIQIMTDKLLEFNDQIIRREEWMCSRAMLTGRIPVVGEGVNYEIDFSFTNTDALEGAALWSVETSKPLDDLERWILACKQNGYRTPNVCLMARDAYSAFINHAKVQKLLDILNMNLAVIEPRMLSENVTYGGTIPQWNLSVYIYDEWFLDDWTDPANPGEEPIVPSGTVLLGSTNMRADIYYGEITIADPASASGFRSVIGEKVADSWIEKNPDRRMLSLESRPLPVPHEVDSWFVATVLDEAA